MGSGGSRFWVWIFTGVLVAAIAVVVNFLLVDVRAQHDLTEDKKFTLPAAAERVAQGIEDDFRITAYLSDPLPTYLRHLRRAVETRLEEFRKASGGKLSYEFIAPDEELRKELEKRTPKIEPLQLQ